MARELSAEAKLALSAGQHRRWALEPDRRAATAPARRGFRAKFERQVDEADPYGVLTPQEREARVDQLVLAHMKEMSKKAAQKRAKSKRTDAERRAESIRKAEQALAELRALHQAHDREAS